MAGSYTFQQLLWAELTAQRLEPDDKAVRYGGTGRSEEKLRYFTSMPSTRRCCRRRRTSCATSGKQNDY